MGGADACACEGDGDLDLDRDLVSSCCCCSAASSAADAARDDLLGTGRPTLTVVGRPSTLENPKMSTDRPGS